MTEALPDFPYHPDPLSSGSVEASPKTCSRCERARGGVYVGPTYSATFGESDCLCPWCIADGSAAAQFGARFADPIRRPDAVAPEVIDRVTRRTPGFTSWQGDDWLFHCDDAAMFLGVVGRKELAPYPDALEVLRHEHDEYGWPPDQVDEYLAALDKGGQPTAYLLECRHCGTYLAYSDST